ncbi:S8 family serine peptidase [Allosphingosinicella deserti]|nr:S8 family serine peptidase [Sphingomonas deserti]
MSKVRILAVLPAQEVLRESASAFAMGQVASIAASPRGLPSNVDIDPAFPAVPLASIGATGLVASMSAARAPEFVVRGEIDEAAYSSLAKDGVSAINGSRIFADPRISTTLAPGCAVGPLGQAHDVASKLDVATLAARKLSGRGVALAIMDTGINLAHLQAKGLTPALDPSLTWSAGAGLPGNYPVDHGTMCAFDALIAAPDATLLDFPILLSTTSGRSAMDGFLSDALQAYSTLLTMMRLPLSQRRYRSLVISNSWGMYHQSWDLPAGHPGRYADNRSHPFNIIVGSLARSGADILFAAGNCGKDCPDGRCQGQVRNSITGANAHPEVITVAGATINDRRVGYSSQGPGIAGMAHAKPDLTSYTHFLGSEAFGAGTEDSGTSAACPVAAGAVAALRTKLPPSRLAPKDLARELRTDAVLVGGGTAGWNRDYGYGIVRPAATAIRLGL